MSAEDKTTNRETVINLLVTSFETGVENDVRYTRIRGPYGNSTLPVKVKGAMSAALNARLAATLSDGETIETKRLVVELTGEFKTFTNDAGQRRRYFSADKFDVVQGPALELARMRREAADVLENAEILRKAGRIDQAYKMVSTTFAEFARVALDLSDFDDEHLIGAISEPPVNAEKAALAQLDREEAVATSPAPSVSQPDDDVVLEAEAEEIGADAAVAGPLEFGGDDLQEQQAGAGEPERDVGFTHDHGDDDHSYDDVLSQDDQDDHYSNDGLADDDRDEALEDEANEEDENNEHEADQEIDAPAPAPVARTTAPTFRRRFG
jgi:hypothetical protein